MKILRIVSAGIQEGGVENGIVLMQPILEKSGHEVRIMASDHGSDLPRFDDYTFKAISKSGRVGYLYRIFNPHSFKLLKRILKEYKPDLVQLHTMAEVSPSVLFLLKDTPTVLTIHGPEEFTPSLLMWHLSRKDFKDASYRREQLTTLGRLHYLYYRYISGPVYRIGMKNIDAVVTFSRYMQKLMEGDGISSHYIPNGTVLFNAKPVPDNETLAYVGRLEKFKGVDDLIKAMPMIIKQRPNARLVIAGSGGYKKNLEELVHQMKLDEKVEFLGHLSRSQTEKVYENSVMLVMPSTWPEAFGKVGIEAMSVGRPIIATDVGGVSDWLINGETGYLIPPNNSNEIAYAAINLLGDRSKLEKMAMKARQQSENFSLERHTELILKLYNSLIKK